MRYFTSDFHFSHPSIIKYCGRNFKSVERMAEVLISQANARAKNSDDVIIHVGDFCCWGNERGIEGNKIKPDEYIKKFNATVVLLEGNHDGNNKVKSHMKCAIVDLGNTYTNVTVGHYPSHYRKLMVLIVLVHFDSVDMFMEMELGSGIGMLNIGFLTLMLELIIGRE